MTTVSTANAFSREAKKVTASTEDDDSISGWPQHIQTMTTSSIVSEDDDSI
jgi:peptide methionine sulfoxide reductase MsrB